MSIISQSVEGGRIQLVRFDNAVLSIPRGQIVADIATGGNESARVKVRDQIADFLGIPRTEMDSRLELVLDGGDGARNVTLHWK